MRKYFGKISIILLALMLIFGMVACTNVEEPTDDTVKTIGIEIDSTTIPKNAVAGGLDLSSIKVKVYLSDETSKVIDLTLDMISLNDRNKLYLAGQQLITVVYEGSTTKFQINFSDAPKQKYTLIVEGGELVAVDSRTLLPDEKPQIVNGKFTLEYDKGTIVTIKWIFVDGYEFLHWTDNGNPMEESITVNITMNQPHYYKAETKPFVSNVYFFTNGATITTLNPKRTNLLNESDINNGNVLIRDGYVFDGWTTTAVDENTSINSTATKINFYDSNNKPKPYKVDVETRLYATWRPLGISCRREEGPNGTTVFVIDKYELEHLSDKLKTPTHLEIPTEYVNEMGIRGRIVGIDANAFNTREASMLKSIFIPETVAEIQDGAFRFCSQLTTIISESHSYTVDSNNVLYTSDFEKLIAYPSARIAVNYEIHQNTRQIAPYAFKDALVAKIVLGSNLERIGDSALNSAHLDRIIFDAVKVTDQTVFGKDLFNSNLRSIVVSPSYLGKYQSSSSFKSHLDIITTLEDTVVLGLNDNTLLYRLIFNENAPDSQQEVEIIGAKRDLAKVTIPITINRTNVFSVAASAFNYCWHLSDIIFPQENNLDRIGKDAFSDTLWLVSLESNINNNSIIINKVLYKYLGNSSTYTLPANVTKIAEGAFYGNKKLTSINMSLNNELIFIGAYAFYDCANLTGNLVVMPKVEVIYNYAFANTSIQNLILQNGSKLKEIGEYAFANCYYLKSAQLSGDVISIATTAFLYDYSLESFTMQEAAKTPNYSVYNGILYKCNQEGIANELFTYPAGKLMGVFDINKPSQDVDLTITSVGDYALFFSNIAAIIIPDTITGISTNAIYIAGLVYVEFEKPLSNITYKLLFQDDLLGIGKFAPDYIVFKTGTLAEVNNFYGHNEQLKLEVPNFAVSHTDFMYNGENQSILYAFDKSGETPRLSVVKSSRTDTEFEIPKDAIKASDNLSYFVKYIDSYAFFGNYVSKVSANSVTHIENYAFYNTDNFKVLDMRENSSRVYILENSFNSYFNNGMLVYIMPGYTNIYLTNWSLDTKTTISSKYLLEAGQAVANFVYLVNEKWDSLSYYDGNKWSQTASDIYTEKNADNEINANYFPIPTRKGYDFMGWKDERLNDIDMSKNLINLELDYFIPYNIDLTAIWSAKVYKVIFKVADGVTMNTKEINLTYDDKTFNYDIPKYPNKKFAYWRDIFGNIYGQKEDETPSNWIETFTSDSVVFYPVWEDVTFLVKYSINGDEGETCLENSKIVTLGNMYQFAIPEKTGYSFEGWTLEVIDGQIPELITDAQGMSLDLWTLTNSSEFIVYPYFKAKQYTITLKVNEDIVNYEIVKKVVFGQSFIFEYSELWEKISDGTVKDAYPVEYFCGWETAGGVRITDDSGTGAKWNVADNITLYAIWPTFINSQAEFDALFANNNDNLSKSYALNCNVNLTKPIGDSENPYTGVFIGVGNNTVTLNISSIYDGYIGMVAYNQGTIKNVNLNSTINIANTSSVTKDIYLGSVAGRNDGRIISTLTGIENKVSIFINFVPNNNHAYIGGIVGESTGTIQDLSCEINTITININGNPYQIGENITAGSLVGNLESGNVIGKDAKYYYYASNRLNDYGAYFEGFDPANWKTVGTIKQD